MGDDKCKDSRFKRIAGMAADEFAARLNGGQMRYPDKNGRFLPLAEAAARLAMPLYGFGLTQKEAEMQLTSRL